MKTATIIIIVTAISISAVTWLVSMWQYNAMMSSMIMFHTDLAALSLFVVIWTAGMAAMMFPAIIPMILVYNRLIDSNNTGRNFGNSNRNSQMTYHKSNDDHDENENANNEILNPMKEGRDKSTIRSLRHTFQTRSYNTMAFVSSYLAI